MNDGTGEWFRITVELGKDAFSHPPPSTFFRERIMSNDLKEQDETVSIGGRILPVCDLPMKLLLSGRAGTRSSS